MKLDHVAVPATDIAAGVEWYRKHFLADVLYQDRSWALMSIGGHKLALVTPTQHPPHVAFEVSESELTAAAAQSGRPLDRHRDGSIGIYTHDPFGNAVELICYPAGKTVYDKKD